MTTNILFIRGLGDDILEEHSEITRTFLESLSARLNYILAPYKVDIAPLNGSGNKELWLKVLNGMDLESYDIIIGHSTGVHAAMKLAETRKLKNLLLTGATPYHNNVRSEIRTGWFDQPWTYEKIKTNTSKIIICNGKRDPYISPKEALDLGESLGCKVYLYGKQRHLSEWYQAHIRDDSEISRKNTILKTLVDELIEERRSTTAPRTIGHPYQP